MVGHARRFSGRPLCPVGVGQDQRPRYCDRKHFTRSRDDANRWSPLRALPASGSRIASRTLQVLAAGVVMLGADPDRMVTLPLYGVAILVVPPLVGRLCRRRFGPLQRAWFSVGLAVHPIGALYGLYQQVWWYDHLAHTASGSLVAGLLYLVVTARVTGGRRRAIPGVVHALVLAGLLLGGVAWEVYELHVAYLHVHGPEDTLADVSYDVVGWLVVAPRWQSLLAALPRGLARRLFTGATVR